MRLDRSVDKLKPQANAASRLGPSTNHRLRLRPSSASLPYPAASGELHGNRVRSADRSGDEVVWRGTPGLARWAARTALGAAALALGSGLHAAGLFLPAGPASDVAPVAKAAPARRSAAAVPDAWERRVRIARHELAAARADVETAGAGRLLLDVRDGVRLDVAVERTAPTMFGYSLSGRVAGGSASAGFVTLVVHEEAVAASIWTPDSAYELRYLGGGVHALRDVTNAPPVECAGTVSAAEAQRAQPTVWPENTRAAEENTVVDVLAVWTPAAEEDAGGEPQMLSRIDMAIAYTNDAFERSGAFVQLNLVGAERVDYSESGSSLTDIIRLDDPDDGHMDGVHDRRDALGADLVQLRAVFDGPRRAAGAFSIVGARNGPSIDAHEFGHNFDLRHERAQDGAFGYQHGFTSETCQSTIMSYGFVGCVWKLNTLPFFASPWRYSQGGRVLGVTRFSKERGARGPADAVLTLNRNRHRVADLRPSRNGS